MTATPRAPETIRATVLVADAIPDLAAGTEPTTALVAGAMTQPIARARPKNQSASVTAPVFVPQKLVSASITERLIRPTATPLDAPSRSVALLDEPAPIISPSASGLMI